ncbi:MAG: class I SAM-dependent rRNA methyltransferase [Gammaproteobacteria bacterium]|nr:class I SAM-dependent rRNA methyltransferase [Gammaproteobacteria bacterium]MDH5802053.1 class I SAM-dependent rRNA methyltransferase [Gammaproteobacteria bacterium]
MATLALKKNEEKRLKAGHVWIYSNEVDTQKTPLKSFEPGETVVVTDARGKPFGSAYVNPNTLICARMISRKPDTVLDQSLITHRLKIALTLRQRFFSTPYYRWVYGEADGLPGLIIDRFNRALVVQISTAGMEKHKDHIVAACSKVLGPACDCIILRNDAPMRSTEGLTLYTETVLGQTPETLDIEENQTRFQAPALGGQKTGWFYDHRINRHHMRSLVKDKRVLDVFSYLGAWGVQAATAGAGQVTCVETSSTACDWIERNAQLNNVTLDVIQGDAFEALKMLQHEQQKFDVIILDPPAFIKRKKDHSEGLNAYRRINQSAMQLLEKDSLLISASCSFHLKSEELVDVIQKAARHLDRQACLIEQGHQGPDHPAHPAIAETNYLKCYTSRVLFDRSA